MLGSRTLPRSPPGRPAPQGRSVSGHVFARARRLPRSRRRRRSVRWRERGHDVRSGGSPARASSRCATSPPRPRPRSSGAMGGARAQPPERGAVRRGAWPPVGWRRSAALCPPGAAACGAQPAGRRPKPRERPSARAHHAHRSAPPTSSPASAAPARGERLAAAIDLSTPLNSGFVCCPTPVSDPSRCAPRPRRRSSWSWATTSESSGQAPRPPGRRRTHAPRGRCPHRQPDRG